MVSFTPFPCRARIRTSSADTIDDLPPCAREFHPPHPAADAQLHVVPDQVRASSTISPHRNADTFASNPFSVSFANHLLNHRQESADTKRESRASSRLGRKIKFPNSYNRVASLRPASRDGQAPAVEPSGHSLVAARDRCYGVTCIRNISIRNRRRRDNSHRAVAPTS